MTELEEDLCKSVDVVKEAVHLYLNCDFQKSMELLEERSSPQIYQSLAHTLYHFFEGIVHFDQETLKQAAEVCDSTLQLISERRKVYSWRETLYLAEIAEYTEEEQHAELLYAFGLLLRSALIFLQDDKFSSFIKGALSIRSSYQTFRHCESLISDASSPLEREFRAGVKLGLGIFHMVLSTLTPKVIHLLEVAGFRGEKTSGLEELRICSKMDGTIASIFSNILLNSWIFLGCFIFATGPLECARLVPSHGFLDLYFKGRVGLLSGQFNEATELFEKVAENLGDREQFKVGCYWELMLLHSYTSNRPQSLHYALLLKVTSLWSPCVFSFLHLICLLSCPNGQKSEEIGTLAGQIDGLRQRIAGRAVPFEKFCARRAQMILDGEGWCLAKWEFIYLWNGFEILARNREAVKNVLEEIKGSQNTVSSSETSLDNLDCLLLKGASLRILGDFHQAEDCFTSIIRILKRQDTSPIFYLYPAALYELARLRIEEGENREASKLLHKVMKKKKFLLENKIHTRARCLLKRIKGNAF